MNTLQVTLTQSHLHRPAAQMLNTAPNVDLSTAESSPQQMHYFFLFEYWLQLQQLQVL